MAMTRKDYEIQALAIRRTLATVEAFEDSDSPAKYDAKSALSLAAIILADLLEKENPRFDRHLFLEAAGTI